MSQRYTFFNSAGSNVDISNRVRAYRTSLRANAEEGSVALSTLYVDDPDGGINITGLHTITMVETAESSNQQRVYHGITADRDVVRPVGESFRTGTARRWDVNLADSNTIMSWRIMRGSDANRPAETDAQRVAWLLGTSEFGGHVTTSRYVSTAFPVAMDAVDYRNQSNQQILDDCAQASGKNYFIFFDEPVNALGLFYDFSGSSAYRSSIRLTNILGFVDNDITFAMSADTKFNRDPSRVYSGVIVPYVGGDTYVSNSATATAFVNRDTMAPSVNVKSLAKAAARGNRYLADATTEADRITTSFVVPLNRVNHLMQGMAVQVYGAHFPVYPPGWSWMRVLARTVECTSEEFYTITVELAASPGGLPAGGGAVTPAEPPGIPGCISSYTVRSVQNAEELHVVFPNHTNGQGGDSYNQYGDYMVLYEGASYRIDYLCYHNPLSNGLSAALSQVGGGTLGVPSATVPCVGSGTAVFMGDAGRWCSFDPPNDIPTCTVPSFTVSGFASPGYVNAAAQLTEGSCLSGDSYGSSLSAHVTWLSGPDPRFEGKTLCP